MIILPPNGWEIDLEKSDLTKAKIVYKEKSNELPKKVDGYYIRSEGNVLHTIYIQTNNEEFNGVYPTRELCEAAIAQAKLIWYRDLVNDGWKPNWEDDLVKHTLYLYENKWRGSSGGWAWCELLSFKTKEIADKFLVNHKDLLEAYKPLMT